MTPITPNMNQQAEKMAQLAHFSWIASDHYEEEPTTYEHQVLHTILTILREGKKRSVLVRLRAIELAAGILLPDDSCPRGERKAQ